MDELTRFAQRLVEQLGASREGVHRAVEVSALRETLLPYRTHRKALGVDSVEDYETVLLRLVSGERGYVRTVPSEAAQRCREELAQSNPDLAVLDEVGAATVQITSMAAQISATDGEDSGVGEAGANSGDTPAATAKAAKPARKVVPSSPSSPSVPSALTSEALVSSELSASSASPAVACPSCHKTAPAGRVAVFCPWCGTRIIPFACSRCNTELDSEWKHCITCGAPVKDPYIFP